MQANVRSKYDEKKLIYSKKSDILQVLMAEDCAVSNVAAVVGEFRMAGAVVSSILGLIFIIAALYAFR